MAFDPTNRADFEGPGAGAAAGGGAVGKGGSRAAIDQGSFIGGEWGPDSQGRHMDPRYSTAMRLSLNGFPVEETAWTSRSGTEFIVPTVGRSFAKLLTFEGSETCSFAMEFTNGNLRFITQTGVICTNDAQTITSISIVDTVGTVSLSGNPSWNNGDLVQIVFPSVGSPLFPYPTDLQADLRNRVLQIVNFTPGFDHTSATTFEIADDLGNLLPITVAGSLVGAQVLHHLILQTPYTAGAVQLAALREIQAEIDAIILASDVTPYVVQITTDGTMTSDPVFVFVPLVMVDGPYLDPQAQTLTISGYSGTITATAGSPAFAATDVGRSIRIFTQPPLYNIASTYTTGEQVTDSSGAWWVALQAISAGWEPGNAATVAGVATLVWAPAPTAGSWAWGIITAYTSTTEVSVTLDTTIPGMVLQPANGDVAFEWQLGVYSETTGYPTNGSYFQGRLWFAGCVPNRFDTTISNGIPPIIGDYVATFSPTDPNGNVLDTSGLSYILNSKGLNQIQWMLPDVGGVLMGTLAGETLIGASTLTDPITPTSIQDYPRTGYGSINQEAIRIGMAAAFIQKRGRRVMEYLDDAFTSKPSGRHLNENAKHLTVSGAQLLAYLEEPVPLVYALMNNGLLAGCTYRRFSRFVQTAPEAEGWHWMMHGGNRIFTSMCAVPGHNGLQDYLFTVTNPPPTSNGVTAVPNSNFLIELLKPPFESPQTILQGWLCDQAPGPGPGNSGYDCGGGNSATFTQGGALQGTDSNIGNVMPPPLFAGFVAGESPPWGGINILAQEAVFFPGSVMLYTIPPYGAPTDENSISLSVWVGTNDFGNGFPGFLFGTPCLDYDQYIAGSEASGTGLIGAADSGFFTVAGMSGPGYPETGGGYEVATLGGPLQWTHLMVSLKLTAGNIICTAYANDTQICLNAVLGTVPTDGRPLLPFLSRPENQGDNGLNVWAIGGNQPFPTEFDITLVAGSPTQATIQVPSIISQFIAQYGQEYFTAAGGAPYFYEPTSKRPIFPSPTPQQFAALYNGSSYVVNGSGPISETVGSEGQPNPPYPTTFSNATGYVGNVAEMWMLPGTYIDWSNSANRYKFHEYDTITDSWGPIFLGYSGALPGFGTPWVYLSGGPPWFPINRATCNPTTGLDGVSLTEMDTESNIIDFDTGLGGGLEVSTLSFP